MSRIGRWFAVLTTLVAAALEASPATAQVNEPPGARAAEPANGEPTVERAREHFVRGVEFVKAAQWAEALVEFERSRALRSHPVTSFNEGACQRALGRYTVARESLRRALAGGDGQGELPELYAADARAFLDEIERTLARVLVSVAPQGSLLTVDGRPLHALGGTQTFAAGVSPPGPGQTTPVGRFEVVLDPGSHVFSFARKGYADAVVSRSFSPGSRSSLKLELDLLPATLAVTSNVRGAIVTFDGKDLGPVPAEVRRPAGAYRVVVQKDGYDPYETRVTLRPGAETSIRASLREEQIPLTKRWWFWTAAAVVVSGGVLTTYALTRSQPDPAPYDGGSTGWVLSPK